jgi:glycosyltransferase involved in cell wall biosynthesis
MSALMDHSLSASRASSVPARVAMFEPHQAGHAHMRYSAPLVAALAQVCPGRRFSLLVSPEGARAETAIPGVDIERVIRVPRTLASYGSPALGVLDRWAHWGHTDRQIIQWVRAHPQVTLIHYQDFYGLATLPGLVTLRRLGVRSLLTVHNVRPHDIPRWQPAWVKDMIDRMVFRHFDALLVHSEGLQRNLKQFIGAQAPPIYVVAHGVGETLRPGRLASLDERMACRQLLFIGAPRPNKGLPLLLEALRFLPEFSLTVGGLHGGDAGYCNHIEKLIASAQQDGCRIQVRRGFVPDEELDKLLRTHSVVMLPYRSDFNAQSGVLSQAIAYRIPVVATDVGAVGETVRRFGLGCVAPPGTSEGLAQGVRRLYQLNPEELAPRLASAARALAWDSVACDLSQVYDDICPNDRAAA